MAGLLSQDNVTSLTGIFARHFDTFSTGNFLIIHKEPLKVINTNSANIYAGYGDASNETNFTYIPVSGIFPCLRVYDKGQNNSTNPPIQTLFAISRVRIKVKEDARQYIKNGRNEKFELDGLTFNNIGQETVQNYLGLKYYYFTLESTS